MPLRISRRRLPKCFGSSSSGQSLLTLGQPSFSASLMVFCVNSDLSSSHGWASAPRKEFTSCVTSYGPVSCLCLSMNSRFHIVRSITIDTRSCLLVFMPHIVAFYPTEKPQRGAQRDCG